MDVDDDSLLAAYARDRSDAAFRELVQRHAPFVYAVARRRLQDVHSAEEVVQEVFLRLARRAGTLAPGPIRPFLFKVTVDTCSDVRRRQATQTAVQRAISDASKVITITTDLKQDRIAAIKAAMDRIPSIYRDAIELRYIHGFSVPEVAEALKISTTAVQKRLVRGLAELKSRLGDSGLAAFVGIQALFSQMQGQTPANLVTQTTSAVHKTLSTSIPRIPIPQRLSVQLFSIPVIAWAIAVAMAAGAVVVRYNASTGVSRSASNVAPSGSTQQSSTASGVSADERIAAPAQQRAVDLRIPIPTTRRATPFEPTFQQRLRYGYMPIEIHDVDFESTIIGFGQLEKLRVEFDWPSIELVGVHRRDIVHMMTGKGNVLNLINDVLTAVSPDHQLQCVVMKDYLLIKATAAPLPATRP